ncbi:pyruvate kinase [Zymomonas sp.]|uniref:pyruvate kinase n=1 Tax=Zymomonas sp. TaxID=2068624 RepID=UPI0025DD8E6B|nr:pyruvate kinase [Zymomonas sp.]MCA1955435.1 pyruvate kinase [Zymomonas sp.]
MTEGLFPRGRKVRVVSTLGPASSTAEQIRDRFLAGADVFRINMSHGTHDEKKVIVDNIRALEKEFNRPTTILFDLQGPKLRVGDFKEGKVQLKEGQTFTFDQDTTLGDETRVNLPHPEIFKALDKGHRLLLDDGKIVVRCIESSPTKIVTRVEVPGPLSDHKGFNVPDVVIPLAALTPKDRKDLDFALQEKADWVALSFVQRVEDVIEAKELIKGRAPLLVKLEKPAAIENLESILAATDAVMVARGDLGVECLPESVPPTQKRIVERSRQLGKPVVVATAMLESMIKAPAPTRAEVSDVANAIYEGADGIMLSAESAAGVWPHEAVNLMHRIASYVENAPGYIERVRFTPTPAEPTTVDALAENASKTAETVGAKAIIVFTETGKTAQRVSRARPVAPILSLTPDAEVARRLGLVWGAQPVQVSTVKSLDEAKKLAAETAKKYGFAKAGDKLVVVAGEPFGKAGTTNIVDVIEA